MTYRIEEPTVARIVTMRRNRFPWRVISRRTGLPITICRKAYRQWQAARAAEIQREEEREIHSD